MRVSRNRIRVGAAIAATVAGLMLPVTPAFAAPTDNIFEVDGDICGSGRPTLESNVQSNDVNEGEFS